MSRSLPFRAAVIGVVAVAALLRLPGLDVVPPAINQDEACRAYDAWCLLETGKDHCGEPWPIFFRAFGPADYPPGTLVYLLIPFQALLGMNVWSTRLPTALLGTVNVWFLYLLIARWYGRRAGLLAAILLAVSPWHLHLSRLAFEPSLCPPLTTLGVLLLVAAGDRLKDPEDRRGQWPAIMLLAASGAVLGLTWWTYNAMRVFLPLLLLGAGVIYAKPILRFGGRPWNWVGIAAWATGLVVGLAPFLWASLKTPENVWGRASTEFILGRAAGWPEALTRMARVYALQVSPWFLFGAGDPSLVQSVPGYGQLHYYCAVLLPLGLYRVIRHRRTERIGPFVLWWILVAPVPAALTDLQAGHSLRSVAGLPAYQVLAALGLEMALTAAQRRFAKVYRAVLAVSLAVVAANSTWFLYLFTVRYPPVAAKAFQAEWAKVFADIQRRKDAYNAVMLSTRGANQLGMLYLFWSRTDPRSYLAMPRYTREGRDMDAIIRIGEVYFLPSADIRNNLLQLPPDTRVLVAERPGVPVRGRELGRFFYPNRTAAVVLYEADH